MHSTNPCGGMCSSNDNDTSLPGINALSLDITVNGGILRFLFSSPRFFKHLTSRSTIGLEERFVRVTCLVLVCTFTMPLS